MASASTSELLAAAAAGAAAMAGEARLRACVREHLGLVWRMLRRQGLGGADADDAAQRVFLVLSRRMHDVEPGRERAFLLRTAVHVASETRRAARRRREVDDPAPELREAAAARPDAALERRQALERLDAILAGMEEPLRAVFVLYEIRGDDDGEHRGGAGRASGHGGLAPAARARALPGGVRAGTERAMNEPKRLLEGALDPRARSLLAAAKGERPDARAHAAVLGALGLRPAGLALLVATLRRPVALAARALASKATIAAVAAAVAVTAGYAAHDRLGRPPAAIDAPAAVVTARATRPAAPPRPPVPAAAPAASASAPTTASARTAPAAPRAHARRVAHAPRPHLASSAPDALAAEIALLRRAHRAVDAGDGRRALALLDEHDAAFPRGRLAEEALGLRVRALRLTGDTGAARAALDALRTRHPSSVLLPALER